MGSTDTIKHLNAFLRGELSAAETYRQALDKLGDARHRATLMDCTLSHEERAELLKREIERRGGVPVKGPGAWGSFVQLLEGAATRLGEKVAVTVLEQGEDQGRDEYRRDIPKLDAAARQFVQMQLLPEQLRTHATMSALKREL